MTAVPPPTVWAQRKDQIFISFELQDVKNEKIDVFPEKLHFEGTSGSHKYAVDLDFFGEIDVAQSKYVVRPRIVEFVLQKKKAGPYWDRLLKEKSKLRWLKVDWNKWKDEDETGNDDPGFDMGGMNNFDFGGEGPAMGESDSDDEDLPDLEEKKESKDKKEEDEEEKKKQETK